MSQLQSTNDTGAANGDSRASCGEQESIGLQQDVDPDTTQGFLDVQEHGHATELISKCVAPIDGIDKPVSMEESGDHDTAEYDLNGLSHDTEQNAHGGHDQGKNAERRERESTHDRVHEPLVQDEDDVEIKPMQDPATQTRHSRGWYKEVAKKRIQL